MSFRNYGVQGTNLGRCVTATFLTWSLLIVFSNAMRYVAPSFFIGLCFAHFLDDPFEEVFP
jgi:hypothetical protein